MYIGSIGLGQPQHESVRARSVRQSFPLGADIPEMTLDFGDNGRAQIRQTDGVRMNFDDIYVVGPVMGKFHLVRREWLDGAAMPRIHAGYLVGMDKFIHWGGVKKITNALIPKRPTSLPLIGGSKSAKSLKNTWFLLPDVVSMCLNKSQGAEQTA